jgi:hypothetical protein
VLVEGAVLGVEGGEAQGVGVLRQALAAGEDDVARLVEGDGVVTAERQL